MDPVRWRMKMKLTMIPHIKDQTRVDHVQMLFAFFFWLYFVSFGAGWLSMHSQEATLSS